MRKTMVIAVREYVAAVKTKAFIVSLVAMPIMMSGTVVVSKLLEDKVDTSSRRVAIADHTGRLFGAVFDAANRRNKEDIFEVDSEGNEKQVKPKFVIEQVDLSSENAGNVALELSDRVREGELLAFIIIGKDSIHPVEDADSSRVQYHSNSPTYDDFVRWASRPINAEIQRIRFADAKLDAAIVNEATMRVPLENLGLVSVDEEGNVKEAEKTNRIANFFLPMGIMMLMLMVVMVGASPLVNSVLEEKMQRIAEVLLGSVSPFRLMLGKLIGVVGVSLTISTVYLVGAFIGLNQTGFGDFFPTDLVWWFVVFQALAVLMFGSMFIAVGAAVSDLKESQSMMMPIMVIVMAPMFVWPNIIKEPNATFAVVASLIPTAAPLLMPMRQAIPPGIPLWQPVAGISLSILTTLLFVFAAGRIFRVGILMQGKGAKIGEMIRWVIRG